MITFERALTLWLKKELAMNISILEKENTIAVNLQEYVDLNRWQVKGTFVVTATFPNKLRSSEIFQTINDLMKELREKKGVNSCYLISCRALPSDINGAWQYQGLFEIRHRVRDTWTIED